MMHLKAREKSDNGVNKSTVFTGKSFYSRYFAYVLTFLRSIFMQFGLTIL